RPPARFALCRADLPITGNSAAEEASSPEVGSGTNAKGRSMPCKSVKTRIGTVLASVGLVLAGAIAMAPPASFADNTTCTPVTVGDISNNPSDTTTSTGGSGGCSSSGTTVDNTGNSAGNGGTATTGNGGSAQTGNGG